MATLTFQQLRDANTMRLPQFRNNLNQLVHTKPDGSDWSPAEWMETVVGELGEYANIHKKFRRGDIDLVQFRELAGYELADVVTYLDLLARRCCDMPWRGYVDERGIDLGGVTLLKFNMVSERVGSIVRISGTDGRVHTVGSE